MKYKVTLNGKVFEVEVERGNAMITNEYASAAPAAPALVAAPAAVPAPAAAPAPVAAPVAGGEVVPSPLPGSIIAIKVSANQVVKKGDLLVIIEAMKMENEILASRDGTVIQVLATVGTTVETGAPLITLA